MQTCEELLINILRTSGINPVLSLPCEKIKNILEMLKSNFFHIPLTREEEGVGISAGAALAGRRPAMFVQSSGMGNMLNALLSLTKTYELSLAIFVSWRGIYNERIKAQVPMGRALPRILDACGISYTVIEKKEDMELIEPSLKEVYEKNRIHVFLMSPAIWSDSPLPSRRARERFREEGFILRISRPERPLRRYPRFDFIKTIASVIYDEIVVSNLGIPSKELFYAKHRPLNFYMLGSMGMATPIGLGLSLFTKKRVIVIDGDGSILMNPGSLGTVAYLRPENLIIIAIDNGSYGSTGDQPTLTSGLIDLEEIARAFGIRNTMKVSSKRELRELLLSPPSALKKNLIGPAFLHVIARPGNKDVLDIPLTPVEIKEQFSSALLMDGIPL